MFYGGIEPVIRTLVLGVLSYVGLLMFLRISGKRTLSKMNAFDLVVTVALGSTLATILLSKDVSLVQGLTALAVLITLQFTVAWASVRSGALRGVLKAGPALLLYRGKFLDDTLRRERVTREEVYQAVRSSGAELFEQVDAVVLETDGSFSILSGGAPALSSLRGLERPDRSQERSSWIGAQRDP